ncbi:DNA-binding NarL/FixJ family response regulator [Dyadobacter jejuensis]|uniref:DNA-binding NarL/FixJ family response regulator n=1 Tax=Dyadobacter jejuensis TaxID=1082580 RepID=A0A316AH79_9BACT|nr:response regulator transcription factor [Dyadobacter jejuensis]PWJ57095.1 DNA-binding NarL/FixJ family response regulator [Dyadobacter jejuensis]
MNTIIATHQVKTAFKNWTALVLDDHRMFASIFAMILERTGLFLSVRYYDKEQELRDFIQENSISKVVLFLDYFIPDTNTLFLMSDLRRFCPKIRIVIVSSFTNASLIQKIKLNQVEGIISKTDGMEHIFPCLKAFADNQIYLSPRIQEMLHEQTSGKQHLDFTARELEILSLFAKSQNVEQIARLLHISKNTVLTHRRNLLSKSEFHSMTELIAYTLRTGLISND